MAINAYIPNATDGTVSVIDTATNTVSTTVTVGSSPTGAAVTPDGTQVYVTNSSHSSNSVSVIDTATNTVGATISVGSNPIGVAVTPDGTKVYVANADTTVSVIDPSTNTLTTTITGITDGPYAVAVTPDSTQVWITNNAGVPTDTYIIDTATNTVSTTINTGVLISIAFTPNGNQAYATNAGPAVSVINTNTRSITTFNIRNL
jgi:YVTN family beta-propeller protein